MAKMIQLQRPITSGSRQAPDPYDQYLESRGLYRKHTARDASSLFRVIAEQLYDTQSLHYEIRLECVRFMTQKRRIFEKVRWIDYLSVESWTIISYGFRILFSAHPRRL